MDWLTLVLWAGLVGVPAFVLLFLAGTLYVSGREARREEEGGCSGG